MRPIALLLVLPLLHAAARAGEPLQRLDDAELRNVNGQTQPAPARVMMRAAPARTTFLRNLFPTFGNHTGGDAQSVLFPLFGILTADVSAKDVNFGSNATALKLNPDGSYTVPLPQTIGELELNNIRINSSDSNSFGNIQMRGIDLSRTVITITPTR